MARPDSTRWTVIRSAAAGDGAAREEFARRYEPVIRAYLGARWRLSPILREIDDAAQEVFLACFKEAGALERVDPERGAGFRTFLYGVVRNVARRFEERFARAERQPDSRFDLGAVEAREEPLSRIFERAWARELVRQATELHRERSRENGEDAARRAEILRLRFRQELPIREIARLWEADPARLHHEYARARSEFKAALREVLSENGNGSRDLEAEVVHLAGYLR